MAKLGLIVLLAISYFAAGEAATGDSKKVVCFYKNWTTYRPGQCTYTQDHEGVDARYCTHLVYYWVNVDAEGNLVSPDAGSDLDSGKGGYTKINALKKHNRDLKTMLNIGAPQTAAAFSKITSSKFLRWRFARNVASYLKKYGFDGAIIDWTYPTAEEKHNLHALIGLLKQHMGEDMVLSVAVPPYETQAAGFCPKMMNDVDFVIVDSFYYRDVWSQGVFHPSPLYKCDGDEYAAADIDNVANTVEMYEKKGVQPEKLIVGAYGDGRSFALKEPMRTPEIGSPAAYGIYQRCTLEGGVVSYDEACDRSWKSVEIDSCKVTLRIKDDLVAAVETPQSISAKAKFAKKYGGMFFKAMDGDDFDGSCGSKQELLSIMYKDLVA